MKPLPQPVKPRPVEYTMNDGPILPTTRAVFFDAVDTLIEPWPSAAMAYHAAGQRAGVDLSIDIAARRFREAFRREEVADAGRNWAVDEDRERGRWQNIVAAVFPDSAHRDALFAELWDHFAKPSAWRVLEGAGETLRGLAARGLALGLASNFDGRLHHVVHALPELAPLQHFVVSSEVGWRKPSPRFFEAAVRVAGCAPRDIVFVGDRRDADYEGARAAGMRAVLLDASPQEMPGVRRVRRLVELLD